MQIILFILFSILYIISLITVDSMFNRLVFREHRVFSYDSLEKKAILARYEWKVIGVVLLLILPFVIPFCVSFYIGGINYLLIYIIIFSLIQWDVIFGRVVFGTWIGDTPHIALPIFGWVSMKLKNAIKLRLIIAIIAGIILIIIRH
jgi:hypothetical protein